MRRFASAVILVAFLAVAAVATIAFAAKDEPADRPAEIAGRYAMSPAEGGGVIRLDSHTGQMSLCNRRDNQWLCSDMPDQGRGLAEEIERLRAENKTLKSDIRRMEDIMVGDGRSAKSPSGQPEGKFGLPSEQDVDQALSYMERMFRKFRDKMKEFDSDNKGTPL